MQLSIRSLVIAVSTVAVVAVAPLAIDPAGFDHRDAVRADAPASAARDVPVDAFASGQETQAGAAPVDRAPVSPSAVKSGPEGQVPVSPSAAESGPEGQAPIDAGVRAAAPGTAVQGILGAGRPVVELPLGRLALDVVPASAAPVTVPPALGPVPPRTVPVADQVIEVLVDTPSTAGAGGGVVIGEGADGEGADVVGSGMGGDLPPGSLPTPPYPQCPITGAGAWWTDPADPYTCIPPEPVSFHEPTPPGIAPELLEPIVEDPAPIGDAAEVTGTVLPAS